LRAGDRNDPMAGQALEATMTTTPTIDAGRTALLLMDFQAGIVASAPNALMERVASARERCRRSGIPAIHVRVAFSDEDRRAVRDRNKSFSLLAGTNRFADGAPETDVVRPLRPAPDDLAVTRTRVGAFSTTQLADELARRGIDTLLLAGIATNGVVLSTVRDAADRDYRLVVLADCCADADPLVHQVLIERVLPRQADVVDSAALDRVLAVGHDE
jgi:nicotinamidase-related amidase